MGTWKNSSLVQTLFDILKQVVCGGSSSLWMFTHGDTATAFCFSILILFPVISFYKEYHIVSQGMGILNTAKEREPTETNSKKFWKLRKAGCKEG